MIFVRPHARGWLQYDIRGEHPDGTIYRERKKSHLTTESETRRWAQRREAQILADGPEHARKLTPKFSKFFPEFKRIHFENGPRGPLKPAQRRNIQSDWTVHLEPALGDVRVGDITPKLIAELIAKLQTEPDAAPAGGKNLRRKRLKLKTVNNVLMTLNTMLARAEEWRVALDLPRAKLFKLDRPKVEFWDFAPYQQLLAGARQVGPRQYAVIKLGARAGLRAGEILGLAPGDIDKSRSRLHIQRAMWNGKVGTPKNGKARWQPVPRDVIDALDGVKVIGRERFFLRDDGEPATIETLRSWVYTSEKRAGLNDEAKHGQIHRLRHTYASHLVMYGVTLAVVQQLMDHANIQTTMRYAHLAPREIDRAIAVLAEDAGGALRLLGNSRETLGVGSAHSQILGRKE